jgi:hypothetical protein
MATPSTPEAAKPSTPEAAGRGAVHLRPRRQQIRIPTDFLSRSYADRDGQKQFHLNQEDIMFPISITTGAAQDVARAHRQTATRHHVIAKQHNTRSTFRRHRRAFAAGVVSVIIAVSGIAAASAGDAGQIFDARHHHGHIR